MSHFRPIYWQPVVAHCSHLSDSLSKEILFGTILKPWHLLLLTLAGWINREQQKVIDYFITENQVLKEKLGKKRILLNDEQRRRLAVKGRILGREALEEIATRRVHFAGCTPNPRETWMKQIARDLTDNVDGFLNSKRYVLMDRHSKFSPSFRAFLKNEGIAPVRLPAKSPDLNDYAREIQQIPQGGVPVL